ncbi:MAG: hypothetical protein CMP67_09505 [Flavobacteriales bacterium]|nr:hypothetical protein [Flavobacteriales bacterium]|tara:strand:+ start:1037 stop:4705 length:3669 start_codon:yes stop_codon:yes gene_type:complete
MYKIITMRRGFSFLSFKSVLFFAVVLFITHSNQCYSQDVNVLIIGSSHSYSEGGEHGAIHEKAFNPNNIGSELQNILSNDISILGNVNVVVEDIYTNKTKDTKVGSGNNNVRSMNFRRYSLAQYYVWPEGRDARLANLRGEGGTDWDYVVLMADPYLLANMPGVFAEGVQLLSKEISKGGAETILFAQWPENTSNFSVSDFNEVVYRIGNSAGLRVVPAGKGWESLSNQDASVSHPTPNGAYLSAAAIYSTLYNKSAVASSYIFSNASATTDIANHAFNTVKNNQGIIQYTGIYKGINPFQMLDHTARHVDFCETGSSTENGIKPRLQGALSRLRMSNKPIGRSNAKSKGPVDLNYGRGNDWYEDNKDYEVNPDYYKNTIGFPMQDNHGAKQWAPTTMLYGIDKRFYNGVYYNDGTDLGIAYNMIRPGTREKGLPLNVRSVPARLMWSRIYDADPTLKVVPDNNHMNGVLLDAIGTYMATILTGRCSVNDEPERSSSTWNKWYARKVAYETAWRMSHLTTRAPGFKVLPSSVDALTINKEESEKLSVRFMFRPKSNVTVLVQTTNTSVGIVGTQKLVFTPENYNVAQYVRVKGVPGATANAKVNVQFTTVSEDVVYNGLTDLWGYTNDRFSSSVTHSNNNTIEVEAYKNEKVNVALNIQGVEGSNIEFAGPNHGSVTWNGTSLEYIPNNGFTGVDGFAYWTRVDDVVYTGYVEVSVLDEAPVVDVSVSVIDSEAAEDETDVGSWRVTRTGNLSSPLQVNFSLIGTATQDQDYTINTLAPLVIPAGQNSIDVLITPIDDQISGEEEETVKFKLLEGEGYTVINAEATIIILDNDEPLSMLFSALNPGSTFKEGDGINVSVDLLGTLTDADELKFLVKKDDEEFLVVHTVNTNDAEHYTYNYTVNEPGIFTFKVIAQKNGTFVTETIADQIFVQETLKMSFITLKDGDVFNNRNKVNMNVECSGNFSAATKIKFTVQKVGTSETVVKTLSISENKSVYKYKWTPKQTGIYTLKASAYLNDVYVHQTKVNIEVQEPIKLKYKLLRNGQTYAVGEDVKMHIRVSGDFSKADELRFLTQKIGEKNKLDKKESVKSSKSMYYNKWVPSSPGEYRLKVKAYKNGKYVKMTSVKITVKAQKSKIASKSDGQEKQGVRFSIYPNPNNGIFNINLGSSKNVMIQVFAANGQMVYKKEEAFGIAQVELRGESGIYFIEITSNDGKQVFKVVKN